jgi:hypothetical protein
VRSCTPACRRGRTRAQDSPSTSATYLRQYLYFGTSKAGKRSTEYLQHICERALEHLKHIQTSRDGIILVLSQAGMILVGILRASIITSPAGIILVHTIRGGTLCFDQEEAAAQRFRARDIPSNLRHGRHASVAALPVSIGTFVLVKQVRLY